jgi:hypothetical protein
VETRPEAAEARRDENAWFLRWQQDGGVAQSLAGIDPAVGKAKQDAIGS